MEDWVVKVLERRSFRGTLVMLQRGLPIMDDDDLMELFRFFWEKKTFAWDLVAKGQNVGFFDRKAVQYERRIGFLLNLCWDELVRRGYTMIMDS